MNKWIVEPRIRINVTVSKNNICYSSVMWSEVGVEVWAEYGGTGFCDTCKFQFEKIEG